MGLDGLVNEHLNKIDLTLNFIDFDCLEESMDCLATLRNLKELFMMGNPCCLSAANASEKEPTSHSNDSNIVELIDENDDNDDTDFQNQSRETTTNKGWENFRMYVIHKLPTLESLDGKDILRSERIKASQMQSTLETELQELAEQCRIRKAEQTKLESIQSSLLGDDDDSNFIHDQSEAETTTKHCPQDRMKLSNEMAMQKAEKAEIEKTNQPKLKSEKDFEKDQRLAIEKAREKEEKEEGNIKQCNGMFVFITFSRAIKGITISTICCVYCNRGKVEIYLQRRSKSRAYYSRHCNSKTSFHFTCGRRCPSNVYKRGYQI